ncbi:RICIN domain-containing protein [Chitinivorax sp. B]|uniref:RICIN domain-containing protein n=1 Tax=Chitinivorax sp. B TaxID=2502235 RepID=UPI001485C12F|nr:RICIN domain-containing protein [Chitinivorax sp. B]
MPFSPSRWWPIFGLLSSIALFSTGNAATIESGRHAIKNLHSQLCMDVLAASTKDGANIQQWSCNPDQPNQTWLFQKNNDPGPGMTVVSYNIRVIHVDSTKFQINRCKINAHREGRLPPSDHFLAVCTVTFK